HPNRFHAACRDTASACPIIAQLTSRSRRMSTMSCMPASTLSNAPLYPARVFSNVSVGALLGNSELGNSCVAGFLSMIAWQSCTHSSQMNTPVPATSVFTSVCAFPQKEQRYTRFAWGTSASGMVFLYRQHRDDSQPCIDIACQPYIDGRLPLRLGAGLSPLGRLRRGCR